MRPIEGGWRIEERREGAARLILKSATGEEIYMDWSPDDLAALRERLAEMPAAPASADPKPTGRARARRAKALIEGDS